MIGVAVNAITTFSTAKVAKNNVACIIVSRQLLIVTLSIKVQVSRGRVRSQGKQLARKAFIRSFRATPSGWDVRRQHQSTAYLV